MCSLRDHFAAWYPLTQEDRRRFVTDGLIVLDTNVLLDLYRMNSDARDDLLALLGSLGPRLWIPHQVGLEFHRGRLGVVFDQEQVDRKLRAAVEEAAAKVHDAVRSVRDHPVIDRVALTDTVNKGTEGILAYLDRASAQPYLSMRIAMHEDPILDAVSVLLDGKVGDPYPADQMANVLAEAKRRIEQKRPPGYADAKKGEDGAAGDYILWRQTLDEAIKRKQSILLITNDQKEECPFRGGVGLPV